MLRLLRITGVVVFAVLIGLSANTLKQMHESGTLFEKYNSSRRANITLLSFSLIALSTLGFFEVTGIQRQNRRRRYYGEHRHEEYSEEEETDGLDSTSIYASNRKVDDWERKRHSKRANSYNHPPKYDDGLGMRFLKMLSFILPILYVSALGWSLMHPPEDAFLVIVFPSVFSGLLVVSLVAALGLNRKKTWGLTFGYILALFNLVIFPVGTALGMILILALVASSQSFADSSSRARKSRQRNAPRSSMAVI